MGMGEPLLNLDRVLEAVDALNDPRRFGLGARHITVSTSGVVPGIRRLTALGPQFTLAVSLHAARDALRDVLVPLNRRWPIAEVVDAARDHARATGRRVSYEVTMISGVNDTAADAHGDGRPPPRRPRPRQPHPDEPGRPHAVGRQPERRDRALRRRRCSRPASRRRSVATAAPRSGRRAASSRPSGPVSRRPPRSPGAAPGSSARAPRPFAASGATSRRRSEWGSSGGHGTGADRGQHPRRRSLEHGLRRPASPEGGRRSDPHRRHGRPFRPEPDVRPEDGRRHPQADGAAARRPPDDQRPAQVHRRVPRRRLRLGDVPRRGQGRRRSSRRSRRSMRPAARRASRSSQRRR